MIGQRLGNYKVQSTLGKGGMATVFLAVQENLGRQVALKVLNPEYARHKVLIERFRRECQALATLQHPNILTIYDSGEEHGVFYFTMEVIHEPTLFQVMVDEGYPATTLPMNKICDVIGGTLDALDFCHQRKVLHRDLKPSNIFVSEKRGAVLADFGLAQLADLNKLTAQGAFLGTELYASPEQLMGEDLDGRSDIYQIGLILYELVAGRLPFPNVWTTILHMKCEQAALRSPRDINPAIPPELEAVLLKSVARKPGDRYATAHEMKVALEAHRHTPIGVPSEPPRMDPNNLDIEESVKTVAAVSGKHPIPAGGTVDPLTPKASLPSIPASTALNLPPPVSDSVLVAGPARSRPVPLQLRIFLMFGLLISVLVVSMVVLVSRRLEAKVLSTEQAGLVSTQQIVQELMKAHYERLQGESKVTANSPKLIALVSTDDPETTENEAKNYFAMIKSDLFVVTNATGKILARLAGKDQEPPVAEDFNGLPVFRGREAVNGTLVKGKALYLTVCVPILSGERGDVEGYLLTGFAVNQQFANMVKSIAVSDIVFAVDDRPVIATLELPAAAPATAALLAPATVGRPEVLAGAEYLRAVVPLNEPGAGPNVRAVVLRNMEPARAFTSQIERILGGLGLLGVMLALVVSYFLTRRLTASLKTLVTAVREMEKGNYEAPIDREGADEIGYLARSFTVMRTSIRAQVENLKSMNQNLKYKVEEIVCREVLGADYTDIKTIGRGAMGIVCRAKNVALDRVVAVKILSPSHAEDDAAVRRFLREAQIMAKLHHPHVLAVYQVRRAQVPYVEMEYFPSDDLEKTIKKKGQLPLDLTVHLFRQIVNAVGFLHDNRIIHRDIKPENVLVQNEDIVKLVDFGIARDVGASRMTVDGEFLGTVAFMSPEQMAGGAVDPRTDIYALGVTLWCMLTGGLPFREGALVRKRAMIKAMPSQLVLGIPREVDAIMERCLADNPDDRFQGCYELSRALEPVAAYVEANVA